MYCDDDNDTDLEIVILVTRDGSVQDADKAAGGAV